MRTALLLLIALCSGVANAQGFKAPKLPSAGYVVDDAGVLTPDTEKQINQIAHAAKMRSGAPIVVVTIPSLASMNASGWSIELYATNLFNTWGIGSPKINRGILVLVSPGDRKARIELGKDWGHSKDAECQQIMDDWMVPEFKKGAYDKGVVAGVTALDGFLKTGEAPTPPKPAWFWPFVGVACLLGVLVVVDVFRNGAQAFIWIAGGLLIAGIGYVLMSMLSGRRYHYDSYDGWHDSGWGGGGGGSSGGSGGGFSGGGSSGGGGATGSW